MADPVSFDVYHPSPILVVISGPAGVGKDAALKVLQQRNFSYYFVVTATTRPPRPGEKHGIDYFFVNNQEFQRMIDQDELIEYAKVYEFYKGIPKAQVENGLKSLKDVILRLDVQGAAKIRKMFPQSVQIFLIPSSYKEWHDRLMNRGSETVESITLRIETAKKEMERISEFDYVIINSEGRLEETVNAITHIVDSERHSVKRNVVK